MPAPIALPGECPREQPPATVLVVDDDELVREMMAAFLSRRGYRVIEAGSADQAVRLLDAARPVDVVLTDVRMPGRLDGIGLACWLRDHRPKVRVLITSGYAPAAQRVDEVGYGPLIPKPYRPEEVVRRILALTGETEPD